MGPGCLLCGRRDVAADAELCGRCRREVRPTPLDIVLVALGWTETQFADASGIPRRTVLRVAKGTPVSRRTARRFADVTGLPAHVFEEGTT